MTVVIQAGETRLQLDQRLVTLISIEKFGFLEPGFEFSQQREKLVRPSCRDMERSKRVSSARTASQLTLTCLSIELLDILSNAIKMIIITRIYDASKGKMRKMLAHVLKVCND